MDAFEISEKAGTDMMERMKMRWEKVDGLGELRLCLERDVLGRWIGRKRLLTKFGATQRNSSGSRVKPHQHERDLPASAIGSLPAPALGKENT